MRSSDLSQGIIDMDTEDINPQVLIDIYILKSPMGQLVPTTLSPDEMVAISQTVFSDVFSLMESLVFD